jgi:SAM-dependent methyltransferase
VILKDIIHRTAPPRPWDEGDNIPWNDSEFSERMLEEHLSQMHDAASRRTYIIDQQVSWIHQEILQGRPSRILDLGCGPGLYSNRLAQLGHTCVGIDYSPASIRYAREYAEKVHITLQSSLPSTFIEQDIRKAGFGEGFDLALFIYGEFNVFNPLDANHIIDKVHNALKPKGQLLLEVHRYEAVQRIGLETATWYSAEKALFSEKPHLVLEEAFWDEGQRVATRRFFILDADIDKTIRYSVSYQAYKDWDYQALLNQHNFTSISFYPSLTGSLEESQRDFFVICAEKN